ncbi:ArsR/SmtB family transcription factor [Actinoplanes teichomyceticus]|uniref:ArsR family transcriptional regulator n=1 Tax=Actinoplanes teichomyceticus TaxID=1867 RepID=A0A561WPL5_ACTTI|nr:metalloregulator ArsR/SmtB family transcription factor [Actinoplanes teichomyceticus]TWG25799.1 ArsR family transcriptional regulator [Actinoplanes teichomyceticus]GIF10874.1 ArsR family transcriptional regulator [Actinoplanes teichomyceticus]
MDEVFKALADPSRRHLLDSLNRRNGQTLRELCSGLGMARQSVSKHLMVLEAAGLVSTTWRGREKLHHLDVAPVNAIADRWISRYDRRHVQALADLKTTLEGAPMGFVYTTYIATTPEKLWRALTDPAFTSRYWGVELDTDWTAGAPVTWRVGDLSITDPEQVVLEAVPHRRLSYTWHTFTPEFAQRYDFSAEWLERVTRESRSRVTFEIEQSGSLVKLTVIHDGFDEGSTIREQVSQGWPSILSSLKTYLETGTPLPAQ